jgi:hypothetical protein
MYGRAIVQEGRGFASPQMKNRPEKLWAIITSVMYPFMLVCHTSCGLILDVFDLQMKQSD